MWLWVLVYIVVAIVSLLFLLAIIGSLLSKSHEVAVSLDTPVPPEALWSLITDFPGQTRWRKQLREVRLISPGGGNPTWLEIGARGHRLPLQTIVSEPPRKLVRRIADPKLPFGGEWVFLIEPTASGSRVTITEKGEVYHPIFRLISKMFDMSSTIRTYLKDLEVAVQSKA